MPDERTYIKVHDGMPDHPKVEPLSDAGFRLLVSTWCWCSRHHTDGRIKEAVWLKRGTAKTRAELMAAGLAEVLEPGLIQMHDYLEWQRSAAQIAELTRKRRQAGSKGGKAKASAKQVLEQTSGKAVPESETEELEVSSSHSAAAKPPKQRPPDLLFDALVVACGIDPKGLTASARGSVNTALKQLREVEATPNQVQLRARRFRERYRDITLTPTALAKHWPSLNGHAPADAKPAGWEYGMDQ